ncbi:MAG: endolytic transglycosylase MltG [Armatimonadetes bacterium]|nr:endolytic transglycosylase MltG [Armatimonadota bacterium]
MRRIKKFVSGVILLVLATTIGGSYWINTRIKPTPTGPKEMIRFEEGYSFSKAMQKMKDLGVVSDVSAVTLYAKFKGKFIAFKAGTYEVHPGMTADEVFSALNSPLKQMVRIPEGWWIARVAKRLEERNVCKAGEYIELASHPEKFAKYVKFPLPNDSLEGYLYPDTFDLPPLLGAKETIKIQLKTFQDRIYSKLPKDADLHRLVTVASMVQCEVAKDEERPRVAGIIENRLNKKMKLQIDATVLYALQEWKVLGPGIVNTIKSPYNTYRIEGLPPGPIGSPIDESVFAAVAPEKNSYLFYVAMPDKSHLFSTEYGQHLNNINKARAAARVAGKG